MGKIDLWYAPGSAPCRAVQMTAKAIGVELNLIHVDLFAGEQFAPEFLKINPQHVIPTLVDDGFALWESRAIQTYLVEKYGKNDSLYPKCPKKRAVVNQRLYFDLGTLYARLADYYYPQIFAKAAAVPENLKKLDDAFAFFEKFLEGSTYAAGETLTVADITLVATVSTAELFKYDFKKHANIQRWYATVKANAPGIEINEAGLAVFKKMFFS